MTAISGAAMNLRRQIIKVSGVAAILLPILAGCANGGGSETATPSATPAQPAISAEAYGILFNQVSVNLLRSTQIMGRLALFRPGAKDQSEYDNAVRLIIDDLQGQLDRLKSAEPVPPEILESHRAATFALDQYIQAASLLIRPREEGDFDFFEFQVIMQDAGGNLHGAGATLPSE